MAQKISGGLLSQNELNDWYSENQFDMTWLNSPSRHQFRWRQLNGRWTSNDRRISRPEQLVKSFRGKAPTDLYFGTAEWLEPIGLPRIREKHKPAPILLDHLVVFDIDQTPFCHRRLDKARAITAGLVEYLEKIDGMELLYISYSGSKGFHVVLKDLEREKFAIEDPRLREEEVKAARKELLSEVLAAGFPVDKTVTADTRRIIRLPGSVHGTTGWVCTIIDSQTLNKPLRRWINDIERHPKAVEMPYWAKAKKTTKKELKKSTPDKNRTQVVDRGSSVVMQASSHVTGTANRSAFISWLPISWGENRRSRLFRELEDLGWAPSHHWFCDERELLIIPLAIPKENMMRHLKSLGLNAPLSQFEKLGHSWIGVSPRRWENGEQEPEFEYQGVIPFAGTQVKMPFSNPHLELVQRLGGTVEMEDPSKVEFAGDSACTLRVANHK